MSLHLKASRAFGSFTLACDLALPLGGILGLFGPSGCGKSTLLRIIAGLDRAPSDVLHWQGRDLAALLPEARRIGLVFQDSRLFPHMTVLGNLQLAAGKAVEAPVYSYWLEHGTREHSLASGASLKGHKDTAKANKRAHLRRSRPGQEAMIHPGIPAGPFIRPGLDENVENCLDLQKEQLGTAIDKALR